MLGEDECYRAIKPVYISGVLPLLAGLQFFSAGHSQSGMYKCDVVVKSQFPTELRTFVDGLELGGTLARAVLRRLSARQSIPPHIDKWMPAEANWRRFQVPLVTDESIIMRWPDDGQQIHLAAGMLYEVRFDRMHEVVNEWDGERIHLQVDQVNATI